MSATLQCTVSDGDLPVRLRWFINGKVVSRALHDVSTSRVTHRVLLLTIESMTGNHAGNYTCEAANHAATTHYTTRLIVNGLSHLMSYCLADLTEDMVSSSLLLCTFSLYIAVGNIKVAGYL